MNAQADTTTEETPTVHARLNEIAVNWSVDNGLPEEVSREEVEGLCTAIADEVEKHSSDLQENTLFSEREAEVWVLDRLSDEHGEVLTSEAIAMYLSLIHDSDDWLTQQSINEYRNSAKTKYKTARQTVGQVTFPNRDEVLTNPSPVWLSHTTIQDLGRLATDNEQNYDAVIQRLVEEGKQVVDLEELVTSYLAERGHSEVAQLAVESESISSGPLRFVSHTGKASEPLPDTVAEAHTVTIGDEVYDFRFREVYNGPQDHGRLTLYASENIIGMKSLDVEQGLDDLKNAVTELTISIDELVERARSRVDATMVTAEPRNGHVHLHVVCDEAAGRNTDRFAHVKRVTIGGEQWRTSVITHGSEDTVDGGITVWKSHKTNSGESVSISDGVNQLRTAMTQPE